MTTENSVLLAHAQSILNTAFGLSYRGELWSERCLRLSPCDFDEGLCIFNKEVTGVFLFPDVETRAKHTTGGWLQPKDDCYKVPVEGWLPADMFREWIEKLPGLGMWEFKHGPRVYCVVEVPACVTNS